MKKTVVELSLSSGLGRPNHRDSHGSGPLNVTVAALTGRRRQPVCPSDSDSARPAGSFRLARNLNPEPHHFCSLLVGCY